VQLNDVIDTFASKINHIHLKENNQFGIKDFCYFGNGTTDNENVVKRMIENRYSGYVDIEVSPEIGNHPFDIENVKKPLEMFKAFETDI
jgi:sugar phosphate isomerase/epimerase